MGLDATARMSLAALASGERMAIAPADRHSSPLQSAPVDSMFVKGSPAEAAVTPSPVMPQSIEVKGGTKEVKLARLAQLAEDHPAPRALGTLRGTMVFAVGNPDAAIMFIGEAPGAEEERQRQPFVGPAGQLLTKIIGAMGLARDQVYITNICKFRPATDNQGSDNRKPTPEEMRACLPFVLAEIDVVQPKVIVALGGTAAEGLGILGPVTKNRGRDHFIKDTPVVVTFHPSYLLRQEKDGRAIQAKRQSWEDMLSAMERAGLAITEKQRGFFKGR